MIGDMNDQAPAKRATGTIAADASPALPSASMSYILARADAYDAIREDEKFAAWANRVGWRGAHGWVFPTLTCALVTPCDTYLTDARCVVACVRVIVRL